MLIGVAVLAENLEVCHGLVEQPHVRLVVDVKLRAVVAASLT
jgi:hypothetical protein